MSSIFRYSKTHEDFFSKHGEKITYKKGHLLIDRVTRSTYVYFLISGIIKSTFTSNDGTERLLGFFLPGTTFAQSGSFFDKPTEGIEYEVVEKCEVYRLKNQVFFNKLNNDNEFAIDYLQTVARNNLFLIERIVYQGEKDIRTKFIKWLIFMAKFYGQPVDSNLLTISVPMTQNTIANFLHSTRESVNKIIIDMKKAGLIDFNGKKIVICDLKKLESQ